MNLLSKITFLFGSKKEFIQITPLAGFALHKQWIFNHEIKAG